LGLVRTHLAGLGSNTRAAPARTQESSVVDLFQSSSCYDLCKAVFAASNSRSRLMRRADGNAEIKVISLRRGGP
jgi:hypothetical protein